MSKLRGTPVEIPCKQCVKMNAECRKSRAAACLQCIEKHHKCSLTDKDGISGPAIDRLSLVSAWSSFGMQRATLALAQVQLAQTQLEFYRLTHGAWEYAIPESMTKAIETAQERVYDAVAGSNAELEESLDRLGAPSDEKDMEAWWLEAPVRAPVRNWVFRGRSLCDPELTHKEVQTEAEEVELECGSGSPEEEDEDVEMGEVEGQGGEKEKEKEKEIVQEAETIM